MPVTDRELAAAVRSLPYEAMTLVGHNGAPQAVLPLTSMVWDNGNMAIPVGRALFEASRGRYFLGAETAQALRDRGLASYVQDVDANRHRLRPNVPRMAATARLHGQGALGPQRPWAQSLGGAASGPLSPAGRAAVHFAAGGGDAPPLYSRDPLPGHTSLPGHEVPPPYGSRSNSPAPPQRSSADRVR